MFGRLTVSKIAFSNKNCILCCFVADEEFDELCFEFGLELDEIVSLFSLLYIFYHELAVVLLLVPQMLAFATNRFNILSGIFS